MFALRHMHFGYALGCAAVKLNDTLLRCTIQNASEIDDEHSYSYLCCYTVDDTRFKLNRRTSREDEENEKLLMLKYNFRK